MQVIIPGPPQIGEVTKHARVEQKHDPHQQSEGYCYPLGGKTRDLHLFFPGAHVYFKSVHSVHRLDALEVNVRAGKKQVEVTSLTSQRVAVSLGLLMGIMLLLYA